METLDALKRLAEEAALLDALGLHRDAEAADRDFTRMAYFKGLQKLNDPRAQFYGGVNPLNTGNQIGVSQYTQLESPCGAIRIPMGLSTGSSDPEALAQEMMESIQQQCPQLADNEAAMLDYKQDLVDWASTDYAAAKRSGTTPAPPPDIRPQQGAPSQSPQPEPLPSDTPQPS